MKNANSSRQGCNIDRYDDFDVADTRYYGLFLKGRDKSKYVLIDPKRFQEILALPDEIKSIMDKRNTPLFRPAKKSILDYNVNFLLQELGIVIRGWNNEQKPFIKRFLSEINGSEYHFSDDDLFQSGILDTDEAIDSARMKTWFSHSYAEFKRSNLFSSLYAQYFHQMASHIDAILLQLLTRNGYEGDKFNRNILYALKGKNSENVRSLGGFTEYDKMYSIWNFLKHNSMSTFNSLREGFPQVLKTHEYEQGNLACFLINFSDELITSIFSGMKLFFEEYCRLVFGENAKEAFWNSDEYFLAIVRNEIDEINDPMGLRFTLL
jgi:hypothetical protein